MNLITHWCPSNILANDTKPKKFCLIILNQPISQKKLFDRLWSNAAFKFCADGGSNRLYDAFKDEPDKLERYLPNEIRGDLDSMRPEVREFYASKNVTITKIDDQDSTDFMKCVYLLQEKELELDAVFDIVAMPALGGRFDQTMASINLLYSMKDQLERRVILVSDESVTVLLDKGSHHIHCQPDYEGPTCGIIPIGSPTVLTTKGLRWNLENHECSFGGMVSTSNMLANDLIEIKTTAPVVWTIEINKNLQQ
ncbi:hypothetical protein VTP01DRAFT_4164 [Rhizomucor pusillus]|uniref:uncharacterized protein n=1 Tax=Rhizomucor pusillus TaxID=4840 RepID=UPI003744423B